MKILKLTNTLLSILVGVLLTVLVLMARGALASPWQPEVRVASPPRLHYQGRLLDPTTGQPKADGAYPMTFGLYDAASAGTLLWSESKDVTVSRGLFSTLLGDTTALNLADFNGQDLWLGVTVSGDPQMTPRQPLAYVPYAIYAETANAANSAANATHADTASNADNAIHADDATHADAATNADNAANATDAAALQGHPASDFASANHSHSTLPLAFGYVSQYTGLRPGSYHVDSATWNDTLLRYEITLTNFSYGIDDITVATPLGDAGSCPAGTTVRTSSVSGNLLVYFVNNSGTKIQCSFNFVSFAGQ